MKNPGFSLGHDINHISDYRERIKHFWTVQTLSNVICSFVFQILEFYYLWFINNEGKRDLALDFFQNIVAKIIWKWSMLSDG